MKVLFVTISCVIVTRSLIITLWTSENQYVGQVIIMAGFVLNLVLILTLSWSVRDSVNKMRQHEENNRRCTEKKIVRQQKRTLVSNNFPYGENEVIEIDNVENYN
jgi:hypothetical protein